MNCTVLVHGFFSAGIFMDYLSNGIKGEDMCTITPTFPTTTNSVDDCAVLLNEVIHNKIKQYEKVNFVGHSMGGLVIRKYLLDKCPANIGRCVFIGTPHKGSILAGLGSKMLPNVATMFGGVESLKPSEKDKYLLNNIEIGCIVGRKPMFATAIFFGNKDNDGEVEITSASSADAKEVFSVNFTHIELCKQVQTVNLVKSFLENGTFSDSTVDKQFIEEENMDVKLLTQGLNLLAAGESLPSMPNIPFPTMGG